MVVPDNRPENKGNYSFVTRLYMTWPEGGEVFDATVYPGGRDIIMYYAEGATNDFLYYYNYDTRIALLIGPTAGGKIVRFIVPFAKVMKYGRSANMFIRTKHELYNECLAMFRYGNIPHPDELIMMVEAEQ